MSTLIKVLDYTKFPGPRYKSIGPYSGEDFRDSVLLPALLIDDIGIDLDGTMGYGSSFLEECFGGLVRAGVSEEKILHLAKNIKSDEEPNLIDEIKMYIDAELTKRNGTVGC